ncbi:cysteine desulfurase NifS [Methanobacterium formicicum]|jgi:cysteine desulfurase|uniref:Cysteine desulfurase IscS n=1 Tax=Methanobacterium formicicum TaxID=2162 RepID=A0A090I4V7_METFO|nr:cysteine desulfurase NifS [Methanobacterium formicicum]MDH2659498.1 cysteine desulfurase NifS [Methanobacterium formicicum]CEA14364.1 Cysteine desulfurase [Methanobacterium formicicum]
MSYMDHSATSPVNPEVLEAMLPYFTESFGNASTLYALGREARTAMENGRKQVASLIGAKPEEVYFTSGGTESDNIAIKGTASKLKNKGNHIITSDIEHPAVEETCKYLEKNGYQVTYLPVGEEGIVKVSDVEAAITPETILITVMHANNEIGTIQPIKEIGALAREKGIYFHTDAVQSVGKIPVNVGDMNVDMLSISAHKLYGPKGIGALYIRKGVRIDPLLHGGGHERGMRPGTENIPGIVGLGKACQIAEDNLEKNMEYVSSLRDRLIQGVLGNIEQSYLNGHPTKRLPNNANFRFTGIEGESLVLQLDAKEINASTGSACSSKKLEPSHVLMAIGLKEVDAHGSLRISLGTENTPQDIDYTIDAIDEVVERLRSMSPLWCATPEDA